MLNRVWTLGALLLLGGCGGSEGPTSLGEDALPGSATSLESLGARVLDALAAGDTLVLEAVRLTETEHNEVVWPELPASRPEVNYPVDLAWQNIELRNRRDRHRILSWYRGRTLDFRGVECRGETRGFASFQVLTDCYIVFDTPVEGRLEAQVFKDVLQRGGGYKIFRYYDEAPRAQPGA